VLPLGGMLPMVAAGALFARGEAKPAEPMQIPAAPHTAPAPAPARKK